MRLVWQNLTDDEPGWLKNYTVAPSLNMSKSFMVKTFNENNKVGWNIHREHWVSYISCVTIFWGYFCGNTLTDLGCIGSLQSWKLGLYFLPVFQSQSYSGMHIPNTSQWDKGQGTPDCSSLNQFSAPKPYLLCNRMLKTCCSHKRSFPKLTHRACEDTSLSSLLLFLVARHSLAYEYNIYLYLFYLLLYLKSLGRAQDVDAGDFQRIKYSGKQLV